MNTKNFNFIDRVVARYRLSKVLKFVDKGDRVLDFGCGARSFLLDFIKNKIKFGVGMDYEVKNGKKGNIEYYQYKFQGKLPFKKNSFNKIYLLAVLEHIEPNKVEMLFKEFNRVIKDNGKIVLTTPTPKSKKILEFLAYKLKIISKEEIRDHKKYYNKQSIDDLCQKTGLKMYLYKLFLASLNSYAVLEKIN